MLEMSLLFIVGDGMEYWQSSQLTFIRALFSLPFHNVCGLHQPRSAHKQMKMQILSVF